MSSTKSVKSTPKKAVAAPAPVADVSAADMSDAQDVSVPAPAPVVVKAAKGKKAAAAPAAAVAAPVATSAPASTNNHNKARKSRNYRKYLRQLLDQAMQPEDGEQALPTVSVSSESMDVLEDLCEKIANDLRLEAGLARIRAKKTTLKVADVDLSASLNLGVNAISKQVRALATSNANAFRDLQRQKSENAPKKAATAPSKKASKAA